MKLIIAGSREIELGSDFFLEILRWMVIQPREIVCGKARGVDTCGEELGKYLGIPVKCFPADWNKHGRAAGHIRNAEMAKYAEALLLIWDGSSRGSANMKMQMERLGKPVYEVVLRRP